MTNNTSINAAEIVQNLPKPGLFKRLLVITYDGMLLIGVIFLASLIFLLVPASVESHNVVRALKLIYLFAVAFLFYGWFWTHGGQTLGMKVWHLYLVDNNGKFISWSLAAKRSLFALISWLVLGMGFTWILLNRSKTAWHDIWSKTYVVHLPPKK
ncbi:MAG: RDD family protein [Pseudomonadota bacterium]